MLEIEDIITDALPYLLDSLSALEFLLLAGNISIDEAISMVEPGISWEWRKGVKYNKNKSIQITFTIKESLYFKFKTLCKSDNKMPASVLKEFIKSYVDEKEKENDGNDE